MRLVLSIALVAAVLFCGQLQIAAAQPAQVNDVPPLGIGLEGLAYPYPVAFFDLTIEGQRLRMAYMDVKPTGAANGKAVLLLHGKSFSGNYWGA
ncbi:MAG: hypothetical protein QOD35_3509, partial [Nocardioidaceae bacterium]|nr:hypothetical protein [Nocardioidaceae bacterium]